MFVSTVISSTPFGRAVDVCKMYCVYHRECERNIHSKVPYKYIPNYCLNSLLLYPLFNLKCFSLWIPYSLYRTPRLLFISLLNCVWLLFESGYYLRVLFIKLGTEDGEIHWLQMPGRQSEETLPCTLAAATDTKLEESDPFTDELEENELILEDC